jgi:hypothetical protein
MFGMNFGVENEHEKRVRESAEFAKNNPEGDLEAQFDGDFDEKPKHGNLHVDNHPGDSDVPEDPYAKPE